MDKVPSWKTGEIMKATKADLLSGGGGENFFPEISTDSRKISGPGIFLALAGEHHDGHAFIEKAVTAGATGILLEKSRWQEIKEFFHGKTLPVFGVDHTLAALGDLARYRRRQFGTKVVAITGSNGKTSTKEFLKSIFEKEVSFLATEGNFNNEVGLPLTLLRLRPENRWAILELGISHPGEMARLSAICEPDVTLITRIDPAHLEGLGSIEGVARAKGEIFSGMKKGSTALINGSDPGSRLLPLRKNLANLFFGKKADCDYRMENLKNHPEGISFDMTGPDGKTLSLRTRIPGIMMAENAFAAGVIASVAAISHESISAGIHAFCGVPGRFQKIEGPLGSVLINDTYNANPQSMKKALEQLAVLSGSARRMAILGSMGELGEESEKHHFELGALAGETGLAALFCYGPYAEAMARGAGQAGLKKVFVASKKEIIREIKPMIRSGDWILVKGSRSMTMDTIVETLVAMK